jgi:hypothetical protein
LVIFRRDLIEVKTKYFNFAHRAQIIDLTAYGTKDKKVVYVKMYYKNIFTSD